MPVIGLTGGIATGKSTVGRLLKERGAVVLSADEASRAVTAPGSPIVEAIAREFGPHFILPDGSLDRSALGRSVFADPQARKRLESLTHPPILLELQRLIARAQAADPAALVVVEAPLLFEAGMEEWFAAVVTVTASAEVQRRRLMERDGLSSAEADDRIASQMPVAEKAARSHLVIRNDGTLEELATEVDRILPSLRGV